MADKITNDITLLFKTKLDEKSKQEVGKNLKSLLENAAIGFDEAEIKRNLEPIVKMMKRLFDKAEIAFDADQLLAMPGRQALQKMSEMEVEQLQMAFDKALAKSGGIKIDFGDMDLSAMTEPLERLTQELSEIGERVASTTKKSVREIENTLTSLTKTKKLDETVGHIEKTLNSVNNPKHYTSQNSATKALEKARNEYIESVEGNDPWEKQYQYLLKFTSKYEAMSKKVKPLIDESRPEFKQLYEILSPKAGSVKISLEHLVDLRSDNELTEYKNQPWARDKTLQNIEEILKNGITVKEDADGGRDNSPLSGSTPPLEDGGKNNKKTLNTKVQIEDKININAEKEIRIETEKKAQAEKVAAEATRRRRIEEEKTAEAVKKIVIYRGIIPPEDEDLSLSRRRILDEKDGAEWWATNKNAAQTYADMDKGGAILVGTVTPKNPLIIDAGGRNYDDFGNMPGIKNIADQLPQLAELIASKASITDIQKYINTRAKELGHDAVQFDNVNDVLNPSAFKELGSTFAILDDSILEVDGAFAQLKYDVEEELGDYSEKATVGNIPEYYKAPEKKLQTTKDVQVVSEASAAAAQEELEATVKTTAELEKQKKLLLYRRVEGEFDPDRISSRSSDALYDKHGKPSIQQALEFDFGGFGDGLYASTLSGSQDLIPLLDKDGVSFFEFDASGYNFFINNTVEQAEILRTFLSSLQKFIGSGTILDASKLTKVKDLSEEELYEIALKLFDNFNMTKEQFYSWIEDAKSECTNISELFAQGKTPQNHHNFGTRFMQTLGYDGVLNDTEDESYNGNYQGSVIFDPDIDKVKASAIVFKTTKEYLEHLKTASENASQSSEVCLSNLREETKAHQDNVTAINNEAEAQEELNKVKSATPDAEQSEASSGSSDTSSAELEAMRKQIAELQEQKNQEIKAKDAEIAQIRETSAAQLEAISNEKATLQNDLDFARQQAQSVQDEVAASQAREAEANQKLVEQEALNQRLREQLAGVQTGINEDASASVGADDLKKILGEVIYRVQIAHDDNDKQANKIALDETALEETLKRVFSKFINPVAETSGSRQEVEPWALDKTLLSVEEVLGQIQTNTAQKQSLEIAPAKTEIGPVLATEGTLAAIKTAKVVKGTKADTSDSHRAGGTASGADGKNAESYAGSQYFPEKPKTQTVQLAKFRAQLLTTGKLTDDVDAQIYELLDSLKKVQSGPDFSVWSQKFQQLKASVGIADIFDKVEGKEETASYKQLIEYQKTRNKLEIEYTKAQDGSALKQFYAEQLARMDNVIAHQQEMIDNEEYEAKLAKLREEQERKLGAIEAKATDKDAKKKAESAKKEAQKDAMLGKASNAVGRAETAWMNAGDIMSEASPEVNALIDEYYQKIIALRQEKEKLRQSESIARAEKDTVIQHTQNLNRMTTEVQELISEYQKLSGANVNEANTRTTSLTGESSIQQYQQQMKTYVSEITYGQGQIKSFDAATKTLTYTVKTGSHEFTEYTVALRRVDNSLVSVQGATKKTETFLEATKRKIGEISSYVTGMGAINLAKNQLKQGIQYIKEIDDALTELKKVTDETEETYDKFLKTASKTADKLGSTIKEVISSTADFSRVGYTLEQSATLAKSALTLMNTSEYTDIGSASEALISALKAYGYAAEESMHVVDIFNEIGENYCRCA